MNEMKLERTQVEAENIELKENELDEVNGGFIMPIGFKGNGYVTVNIFGKPVRLFLI